jgi:acyl carrier protein
MAATVQEIEEVVYDGLEFLGVDRKDISPDMTLEALDVDSLDLLELGQMVKDRTGIKVEAEAFADVHTVGDAVRVIASLA